MQCTKCRAKSLCGGLEINQNCSAMQCKTPSAHVTKIIDAVQCDAMQCGAMRCSAQNAGQNLSGSSGNQPEVQCNAMQNTKCACHKNCRCSAVRCDAMQCGAMRCSAQNAGQNLSVEVWKSTRTAVQCNAKHPVRMSQKLSMQFSAMRCNAVRCDAVHKMQGKISLWRSGNQPE